MSRYEDEPIDALKAKAEILDDAREDNGLAEEALKLDDISRSECEEYKRIRRKMFTAELRRIKEEIERRANDNELDDPVDIDIE